MGKPMDKTRRIKTDKWQRIKTTRFCHKKTRAGPFIPLAGVGRKS